MAISKTLLLKWMLGGASACLAGIGLSRNFTSSSAPEPAKEADSKSSAQQGNGAQTVDGSSQQQPSSGDNQVTETGSEHTGQSVAGSSAGTGSGNVAGDRAEGNNTQRNDLPQSSTLENGVPNGDGASRVNGRADTEEQVQKPGTDDSKQPQEKVAESPVGTALPTPGSSTTDDSLPKAEVPSSPATQKPQGVDSPEPVESKQAEIPGSTDQVQDSSDLGDGVQGGDGHVPATPTEKSASEPKGQEISQGATTDSENPTNPSPSNPAVGTGGQNQDRSDSHQSSQDPAPIQISTPQGEAGTTGTGSEPLVTNPTGASDNTVDTASQSGLQEPKESQNDTQDPGTPSSQDSEISSQPQPQQQQQVQEATEETVKTSTGGGEPVADVSKTDLGQGAGGDTTEGNDLQTKGTDTSDSVGKQGDKASKVEGADAGSEGLQGSNGDGRTENQVPQATEQQENQTLGGVGAGGANVPQPGNGESSDVAEGQKDGGSHEADPSSKQQSELGADNGQALPTGEGMADSQKTATEGSLPSATEESKPGEGATVTVPPVGGDGAGESLNSNAEGKTLSQGVDEAPQALSGGSQPLSDQSPDTQQQVAGGGQVESTPVSKDNKESSDPSTDDNQSNLKPNVAGESDDKVNNELDENAPTNEVKEGETTTTVTEPITNPVAVPNTEPGAETQTTIKTEPSSDLPGSSDPQTVDNTQDSLQTQSPSISTSDTTGTPGVNQDKSQVPGGGAAPLPKAEGQGDEQPDASLSGQASEIAGNSNTDGSNQGGGSDLGQISRAPSTPTIEGGEKGLDSGASVNAKEAKDTQEGQQGTSQADPTKPKVSEGSGGTDLTTESTTTSTTTSEVVEAPAVVTGSSSEKAATTTTENSDSDSSDQASRTSEPQPQQDEPNNSKGQPGSADTGLNNSGQSGDAVDQVDTTSGATQRNTAEQTPETPTVTEVTEQQKSKPDAVDGVQEQAPAAPVAGEKDSSHQVENVPAADISDNSATENSALPSPGAAQVSDSAPKGDGAPSSGLATDSDSVTGGVKESEKVTPDGTTGQKSVTDVSNVDQISQPQSLGGSSESGASDQSTNPNVTNDGHGGGSQDLNGDLQGDDPNALTPEEGKVDTKSPQDKPTQEDVVKKEEQEDKGDQISIPPAIEPATETNKQVSNEGSSNVTQEVGVTPPSAPVELPQPPQQPLAQNQDETSQPVVNTPPTTQTPAPESSSTATTDDVPQTEDKVEEIDLSGSKEIREGQDLSDALTNNSDESISQVDAPSESVTVTNSRKKRSINPDFKKKLEDTKKVKSKLKEMGIGNASCKIFRKKSEEKDYALVCQISFAEIMGSTEFMDKWKESGKEEEDEDDVLELIDVLKVEGIELT